MKINYINDNMFLTNIIDIAHGCNNKGVQGAGVAKLIKLYYPSASEEYTNYYNNNGLELGDDIITPTNGKIIHHLITQDSFGYNEVFVKYDAVRECMKKLNKNCSENKVAMPMIGAGLGGGDWDVISSIIEQELTDVEPYVYYL